MDGPSGASRWFKLRSRGAYVQARDMSGPGEIQQEPNDHRAPNQFSADDAGIILVRQPHRRSSLTYALRVRNRAGNGDIQPEGVGCFRRSEG
jgi:hypothetical protein